MLYYLFDKEACIYDYENSKLIINKWDNITNILIDNLVDMLREISDNYPKNVIVREEKYHD